MDQYGSTDGSTSTSTTTDTYDRRGNLIQADSSQDPETIHYQYDDATGLKVRTWTVDNTDGPTSTDIHYGYYPSGRLRKVTAYALNGAVLATPQATLYTYNPDGSLNTTTRPNSTVETRSYDGLGQLTEVATTDANDNTIASFTYALDDDGLRLSETDADGRATYYTYDHDGRLTGADVYLNGHTPETDAPDRTYTYSYDLAGNRVGMTDSGDGSGASELTYSYDADGRLTEAVGTDHGSPADTTYTYDTAGNTKTATSSAGTTTDTWDLQGRLVQVQTPAGTTTYTYGPDGQRTSQTVDGVTTNYLNDPTLAYDQVLEEYEPGGARLATYVRGHDLLFQDRGGTESYYVHDGLGSTRALTDANGGITDTYTYDPYGGLTATGNTVNPYLYAGQRRDAAGNYVMGSRTYDVSAARFTSRDSYDGQTDDPITQNHYLYVSADPINYIDPSGHDLLSTTISIGLTSALSGLLAVGVNGIYNYSNGNSFFDNAGRAALTGGVLGPLAVTFPLLGMTLAGIGLGLSIDNGFRVFGNPNSTGGQQAASIFLIGLSVFGGYSAARSASASESIWINAKAFGGLPTANTFQQNVASVRARVGELQAAIAPKQSGRITLAYGLARGPGGNIVKIIGTSEPNGYMRSGVRGILSSDEVIAPGAGNHAEVNVVNYARDNGLELIAVGATRPICTPCAVELGEAGVPAATPLKDSIMYDVLPILEPGS